MKKFGHLERTFDKLNLRFVRHILVALFAACPHSYAFQNSRVGEQSANGTFVATGQWVKPAGKSLAFAGRPVDLAFSADGGTIFVKTVDALLVLDAKGWKIRQTLKYEKSSGSMHGIAAARNGTSVYVSDADSSLLVMNLAPGGNGGWGKSVTLPGFDHGASYPCGIALSPDGKTAYVALSRNNSLAVVDLALGTLEREIATGIAPYDVVLSPDGLFAYVSNWGGRRPSEWERTMNSSGTNVLVDSRSIPASGTVSTIDLRLGKVVGDVNVGLHPSDLEISRDGGRLYCANANSDNISLIATEPMRTLETIPVITDSLRLFGNITNAIALSADEKKLYAANGGNNSVAEITLGSGPGELSKITAFIPTGWFPCALIANNEQLFIANAKGEGSRQPNDKGKKWSVRWNRGTVTAADFTEFRGLNVPFAKSQNTEADAAPASAGKTKARVVTPLPVPLRAGEPSVFEHVVYVLKENRTYDQLFGDMKRGNSDPALCIYGRTITPNHHALADEFVLLDNYYCNGIVSADGHQWATQGVTTDYQEKTFGAWTRTYDFGTDPLTFAPTEFIWENAVLHGKTFRNYGEFDFPVVTPDSVGWKDIYHDHERRNGKITFTPSMALEPLRKYSSPSYPGWDLRIPDMLRLDRFLEEFEGYQERGDFPNLVLVYLPQDHTSGLKEGRPTPRAHLADNDLALGKLVEAISKSRFWPKTCVFVNEDDPQDGFDHVDGHRSICLVVSPYTKKGKVISRFYNQTSVLHTIERMLGLPPMNMFDAMAPTMEECFVQKPDFKAFIARPNTIPIDEMNKHAALIGRDGSQDAGQSEAFDFSRPDRIDDETLNRILWRDAKGAKSPYPARYAGAHGSGLKALHLEFDRPAAGTSGDEDEN